MEKQNQEQLSEEVQESKAARCTDRKWAESYARYYQAQTYDQGRQTKPENRKAGNAAMIITAVLLTVAVGIVLLAVYHRQLLELVTATPDAAEEAVMSLTEQSEPPQLDADTIRNRLQDLEPFCSECVQLESSLQHEEGGIPFISKRSWTMSYQAEVVVGFSPDEIQIQVEDHQILITLPEAVLQSITVDPDSIEYSDEVQPLFGEEYVHDLQQELEEAREDAEGQLDLAAMKSQVEQQAEDEILSELATDTEQYQLIIRHL